MGCGVRAPPHGLAAQRKEAALCEGEPFDSITFVRGEACPFALTGTLLYVRSLQQHGFFDVQISGCGRMETYHAPYEFADLAHRRDGFRGLSESVSHFGGKKGRKNAL